MKNIVFAVFSFLIPFPALGATQEPNGAGGPPPIEPLSTGYLLLLGVVFAVIVAAFWKYYMRFEDDDKSKRK